MNSFKLKKLFFVLFVALFLFQFVASNSDDEEKKEEGSGGFGFHFSFGNSSNSSESNYSDSTCFRILQTAPWSTKAQIKRQYDKLSYKYSSRDREAEKKELDKAYKTLEAKFKDGSLKECTFYEVVFKGLQDTCIFEGIFGLLYLISKLVFKFQQWFNQFIFYQVASFLIIGRFFPHYFDNSITQYAVSLALGCLVFFRGKIFGLIFGKKGEAAKNENKKTN